MLDENHQPIAAGSHDWENQLADGIWTYSMDAIHIGIRSCFAELAKDVQTKFGIKLTTVGAMGIPV